MGAGGWQAQSENEKATRDGCMRWPTSGRWTNHAGEEVVPKRWQATALPQWRRASAKLILTGRGSCLLFADFDSLL
jgi:hypothetical protein